MRSIQLSPTDQGVVNVTLLNGRDIHAADRGGKYSSDLEMLFLSHSPDRQVRSFHRVLLERPASIQVSDEEEDRQP